MTAKVEQTRAEREQQESGALEALIRDNVLSVLGNPPALHRVQVKCLWPGRYRVNIFVGDDTASLTIAHSFFVEADSQGKVLTSNPPLARSY